MGRQSGGMAAAHRIDGEPVATLVLVYRDSGREREERVEGMPPEMARRALADARRMPGFVRGRVE